MREVATIRHWVPPTGDRGPRQETTEMQGPEGGQLQVALTGKVISISGEGEIFYVPTDKLLWMRIEVEE